MATLRERMRWNLFQIKRDILFWYGIKTKRILSYDTSFLSSLRNIYYGPIPLSLLFLLKNFCDGFCYYRAPLSAYGFLDDDFICIDAKVNSLNYDIKNIDDYRSGKIDDLYGEHCYIERTLVDGSKWVYDTSLGLVFEECLFCMIENPKIRKVNNKESTINFIHQECPVRSDLGDDLFLLPILLETIETNMELIQPFYIDAFNEEVRILKEKFNIDQIIKENENIRKGTT